MLIMPPQQVRGFDQPQFTDILNLTSYYDWLLFRCLLQPIKPHLDVGAGWIDGLT